MRGLTWRTGGRWLGSRLHWRAVVSLAVGGGGGGSASAGERGLGGGSAAGDPVTRAAAAGPVR